MKVQRFAKVIGLRADKVEEYVRLHAAVWPGVSAMIRACHIRNFSIYLRRLPYGKHYLFMYYEYTGTDHAADMAKMAADPETRRWWQLTDPCQEPLPDRTPGEWWAEMTEVCHLD